MFVMFCRESARPNVQEGDISKAANKYARAKAVAPGSVEPAVWAAWASVASGHYLQALRTGLVAKCVVPSRVLLDADPPCCLAGTCHGLWRAPCYMHLWEWHTAG